MEILSQTKDPTAVQPYLNKCFEGIAKVTFDDKLVITEIISSEGEVVPLQMTINPNAGKNKGAVENWLLEVQLSMRVTIKGEVKKSMESYPVTKRTDWLSMWPAMCVLNVSQLFWTRETEDLIKRKGAKGVSEYLQTLYGQLKDIVQLVRGKLTKMQRKVTSALCTIDVHARAVLEEMEKVGVRRADDFEWLSQLRYYWEHKPDDYNRYDDENEPHNLIARILNAFQMYGYEYLGNSSRLVITPLTDRCYRTLMGAVSLQYGGAPAGPAGTGKTETTKDLSKACAIQCVVLNCSPEFDYKAMGKFFKGLAQSGSWSCFDEFNRIILEVLSVIAQQILTIQKAKRSRAVTFEFEGTKLSLNPDANVFITMNPGYAGRQELPDNLKALFRPCAMMVPDYALIAEVMLFAKGFQDGDNLARKLTQVLKLSLSFSPIKNTMITACAPCSPSLSVRAIFACSLEISGRKIRLCFPLSRTSICQSSTRMIFLSSRESHQICSLRQRFLRLTTGLSFQQSRTCASEMAFSRLKIFCARQCNCSKLLPCGMVSWSSGKRLQARLPSSTL